MSKEIPALINTYKPLEIQGGRLHAFKYSRAKQVLYVGGSPVYHWKSATGIPSASANLPQEERCSGWLKVLTLSHFKRETLLRI